MNEQKFRAEVIHEYILKGKYTSLKPVTLREADSDHTHKKEPNVLRANRVIIFLFTCFPIDIALVIIFPSLL